MKKGLFFIFLIACVLIIGGYLFIRFSLQSSVNKDAKSLSTEKTGSDTSKVSNSPLDLRPLFIARMQQLIKNSSNGLYDLSVGDMEIDILQSTVELKDVTLTPADTAMAFLVKSNLAPDDVFKASFKTVRIEGINLDEAVSSKTMDFKIIRLVQPVIEVRHKKRSYNENDDKEDFSKRILKQMEKIAIGKLIIEKGTIISYNDDKKGKQNKLNNVSVNMMDILIDSATRKDKDRFLFSRAATLSFQDYVTKTTEGLYNLKIGGVTIKAPQQVITLQNLSIQSLFSKEQFVKKMANSKELYDFTAPSITVKNVNWWRLLNEEQLVADELKLSGGKLKIYLDRSLPPKNKMGSFPNQLIMKIPMKINIAKTKVNNLDFSYEEYNPVSKQSGIVYIDDIALDITNLNNMQVKGKAAKPLTVKGSSLFMHTVPLTAEFNFSMANYKSGKFSAKFSAGGFDGSLVNSFAMPMGMAKIEKGTIQKVEAQMQGDQCGANGDVLIMYKDLKLSLLEKDKGEKKLDKKGFTTLVANLFILKKDNPKDGKEVRNEKAEFKRIPEGGFFMLIWKTVMIGTLKTIGAPTKIAKKTVSTTNKNNKGMEY